MNRIFFNGKWYKVINTYTCPFYGTRKAQFYVNEAMQTDLQTREFKAIGAGLIAK